MLEQPVNHKHPVSPKGVLSGVSIKTLLIFFLGGGGGGGGGGEGLESFKNFY